MLDLPQLDPISPQLDLPISPAHKLQLPIRTIPHQISRPIHPPSPLSTPPIRHKTLRRQIRSTPIPSPHTLSSHIPLSHYPLSHPPPLPTHHTHSPTPHWPPDPYLPLSLLNHSRRRHHRPLRWPIMVHHLKCPTPLSHLPQPIPSRQQCSQSSFSRPLHLQQPLRQRRRHKTHRDPRLHQPVSQLLRLLPPLLRHYPHTRVKGHTRHLTPPILRLHSIPLLMPVHQITQPTMLDLHPFGPTRRSR